MSTTNQSNPPQPQSNPAKDFSEQESSFDIRDLVFKLMLYWPWFLASVICCLILGYVYLRYKAPVYEISGSVLIEEQNKRNSRAANAAIDMSALGMFSMTNNFDNEVVVLSSRTLVKKVVTDLELYTSVAKKRTLGYSVPLYKDAPVRLAIEPDSAEVMLGSVRLKMHYAVSGKMDVLAKYVIDEKGHTQETSFSYDSLPATVTLPNATTFMILPTENTIEEDIDLVGSINSPTLTATAYSNALSVSATSKTTTIAQISVKDTNRKRAVDFLNRLVEQYNIDANNEKNEVARKTAEFIDDRLQIINAELGSAEQELANFKQQAGLTNLSSDVQLALTENAKYDQQRIENATQVSLVKYLQDYVNSPANYDEVIPAHVGLQDANLTNVINQYNAELIETKRLAQSTSEANPVMRQQREKVSVLRESVKTTIASVLKGLSITGRDINAQATRMQSRISSAPRQETEFLSKSRQQEIKATLYVMLLQKREENAITLSATANNGRIIEEPMSGLYPVSPKRNMIMLLALLLGFAIPYGVLYLFDFLKYKIENRNDVESITSVPIIAELPKSDTSGGNIVVHENCNEIMEEVFRGLRTNLLFMLKPEQRVVMFSSTQPGEGKSFIAGNTAVSMAFLGKKVVVVGMDIRKPGLNRVFDISRRADGITSYLSDPEHVNLMDLVQTSDISPNLFILPGGAVPPNPTELVSRPVLDDAINQLKEKFDIVILDTAPIAMVTDSSIIARVADACVYVCRADVTPKAGFSYVNVLRNEQKFAQLCVVINGIDMTKRKNSYGYGYGKRYGYGYGKRYGYGYGFKYGYGYGYENGKKVKKKDSAKEEAKKRILSVFSK